MARQPNRFGGGARTNANGLYFEQTTSLNAALEAAGYTVNSSGKVLDGSVCVGMSLPKNAFYKGFLEPKGVDYTKHNSKKWLPDEAFVNYDDTTVYIIEKKFQKVAGSVDEKLPNCDFKKREYGKLLDDIKYDLEFIYVLSDWFKRPEYRDVLEYIEDVGCHYYFNELPLDALGL